MRLSSKQFSRHRVATAPALRPSLFTKSAGSSGKCPPHGSAILAARRLGQSCERHAQQLGDRHVGAVFLHQAALGVIGAGVRAIPIGHTHGQQVLARLHDDVMDLAEEYQARDLESAGSNCPAYEVLCDEQSQLYTRIFRS